MSEGLSTSLKHQATSEGAVVVVPKNPVTSKTLIINIAMAVAGALLYFADTDLVKQYPAEFAAGLLMASNLINSILRVVTTAPLTLNPVSTGANLVNASRLMLLGLLLTITAAAFSQEPAVPKKVEPNPKTVDFKNGPIGVQPPSVAASGRRELTFRQRRELGLTVSNLVEVAKELKAEGEIDKDTSRGEIAASIAERLASKSPQAFKGVSALDLDSIIAFIERLLPLILKLIDLFAYVPNTQSILVASDVYWNVNVFALAA